MPWTFVHPAAVLPLRRLCVPPTFAALVIGTLTPDFGYYVNAPWLGTWAHTLAGSLAFDLPLGAILLLAFSALRKPLWFALPQPHRDALSSAASRRWSLAPLALLMVSMAIVVGAWTHIAWDAFTHEGGWIVRHAALLQATAFHVGRYAVPVYKVLQHLSSLAGALAIAGTYFAYLRRKQARPLIRITRADAWRFAFWAVALAAAATAATPLAAYAATGLHGEFHIRVFVVRGVILATMAFLPLAALGATICYLARPWLRFQELTGPHAPD